MSTSRTWARERGATHLRAACLPNKAAAPGFDDPKGFRPFMVDLEMQIGE